MNIRQENSNDYEQVYNLVKKLLNRQNTATEMNMSLFAHYVKANLSFPNFRLSH